MDFLIQSTVLRTWPSLGVHHSIWRGRVDSLSIASSPKTWSSVKSIRMAIPCQAGVLKKDEENTNISIFLVFMFKLQRPWYDEWNIINWFRKLYIYIYIYIHTYIIDIICSKTLCKLFRSSLSAYCFSKQICWIILDVILNLLFITLNLNRLPILSYEWENKLQKIKIRQIHFLLYLHWKLADKNYGTNNFNRKTKCTTKI